jgi:membrane protein
VHGLGKTRQDVAEIARGLGRSHPVSDVALWGAGLSFFGAIGLVPLVMVILGLCSRLVGSNAISDTTISLLDALPNEHGIRLALRHLLNASQHLSWLQMALFVLPTTVYGEGLRRAFLQMSRDHPNRFTGWWGRVLFVPVIACGCVIALVIYWTTPWVASLYVGGGWQLLGGVVVAFHITFALSTLLLAVVYRLVGTVAVSYKPLLLGSAVAAAIIAGFLQGFLMFLAIPMNWSKPFGNLTTIGPMIVLLFWMWVIHLFVIMGYRLTLVVAKFFGDKT